MISKEEKELRGAWKEYSDAGHPRRFYFQRMFLAYNGFFNKKENNPTCSACIRRVVKSIKLWLKETN